MLQLQAVLNNKDLLQ